MVVSGPLSHVKVPNSFSTLLFVPPAPELSAEIKRAILHCLLPLILQLGAFHTIPFKIRFTMTSWLSHYIIFKQGKEMN